MLRTKRVYDKPLRADGTRVLVMRLWPRGIRRKAVDVWLKDLGAEVANLRAFKAGRIGWPEMRRRYLADLKREGRVLERLHHRAAAEVSEVAALRRRAGILRIFLRQLGEALGRLARLGDDLFGLLLRLHENVARASLLGDAEPAGALRIGFPQFLLARRLRLAEFLRGQHQILSAQSLRNPEIAEVGLVVGLGLRFAERGAACFACAC